MAVQQREEANSDAALSKNDVAALLALYAPNAELESPLVSHLFGKVDGVGRGREELRRFLKFSQRFASSTGPGISPTGAK